VKTYEIELKRESYKTIWVEAESQEQAEAHAWKQIEANTYREDGLWEIASIEEQTK
jgi:hypothetical protein